MFINPPLNVTKKTFSVSSCLSGLLLARTSWKVDKTLLRRVMLGLMLLFVGIKDKSQTNYGDIYNRIICCLGISGKQSERGQREKKEKQMLLMLGTELCCAVLWDQGKHILFTASKMERHHYQTMLEKRCMAGKTGREKMHWSVNKHIHTFVLLFRMLSFASRYQMQKSFLYKINKVAMKDKCTKKTYREYHSISVKHKPTAVLWLFALQCFMR